MCVQSTTKLVCRFEHTVARTNISAVKNTHYLMYSARYVNVPVAIEIIQGIA